MTELDSLHVLGSRQFGSADQFFVRLVEELNAVGHRATALTRAGSPVAEALSAHGTPQRHLPLASKWDVWTRWRIQRLAARERPPIVQTYMGRATRLTQLPADGPSVHVARLGGYYKIRGYYEHAHAWVGNTRGVCDYLVREGLPADRVFLISNFVADPEPVDEAERAAVRRQLGLPDDAWLLFTLGRFVDIKGFDDLLEAFSRLPTEVGGRPLRLVIAGDGPMRETLHALCTQLGLDARVHWAGWQNRPAPFFALADALVCPSRHETLGNVILEAWAWKLPVVSTRTPGALELVEDGINGLLAPVQDPPALADALSQLLAADAGQRAALVAAGTATLERRHGRQMVVQAYLDLYRDLARQRGLG